MSRTVSRISRAFVVTMFMVVGCLVVLLLGRLASAQDSPPQESELTLEPVVVSGARISDQIQELRRVPGQVYVITSEEIERTKPRTVQEALQQAVPGIVFYDMIGNRFQQTVDLRGFNGQPSPSVSVFVDGVRVNEPDFNQVNFDLIPIQDIERIEVLPGATALYGRNALGGVINITTKRGGKTPQTTVESDFGSDHHYQLKANTSGPVATTGALKDLDYYASVVWDRESGFRQESDGRVTNFTGRLGYRPSDATDLSFGYQYVSDRLEQPGSLPLSLLVQDRQQSGNSSLYDNDMSFFTFQGRQQLAWGFSLAANGSYRKSSLGTFQGNYGGGPFQGIMDTATPGGTLQLSNETQFWGRTNRFVLGGELDHSDVTAKSWSVFGPSDRKIGVDDQAFFAQETFDLTREIVLTGSVRYDTTRMAFTDNLTPADNDHKTFNRWTPRAGITYTPWQPVSIYFNYGQGFRVPTSDELFAYAGFGSNPDLKPVTSTTYETGVRVQPLNWINLRAAFFVTDVQNEIVYDSLAFTNRNAPESRRQGVEFETRLHPHAQVDLQATYAYTDARYTGGTAGNATLPQAGDRVALVPLHRLTATATYRPIHGMEISLDGTYVGRQVLLNNEVNLSSFRVQDYYVLNLRASYTWKLLTAFLRLNNLTNNKYETYGIWGGFPAQPYLMPAPGISVLGGLTIRFENYY